MKNKYTFPGLLQAFFTQRLMNHLKASPETIASYRDTFRLLLKFIHKRKNKMPSKIKCSDLNVQLICDFLNHLEKDRGNSIRTRNHRLAAIRSFLRFVSFYDPSCADQIQRIMAIPSKRCERKLINFLSEKEVEALLKQPVTESQQGRRDYAWLFLMLRTGLRVSELINLRCEDVFLKPGAYIRCRGKGRKERCIPLGKQLGGIIKSWLKNQNYNPDDPLFPNNRQKKFSRDGIEYLLAKYVNQAKDMCPSIKRKKVTPHVLRHTTAVGLLQAGVESTVISLWLGHESPESTQVYIDTDLAFKEKILEKTMKINGGFKRFKAEDKLLAFLQNL